MPGYRYVDRGREGGEGCQGTSMLIGGGREGGGMPGYRYVNGGREGGHRYVDRGGREGGRGMPLLREGRMPGYRYVDRGREGGGVQLC